ncbi:MAG TPA: hypothetical protein VHD61_07195 [Lacunisphaera sp.]|nr:hypothetical protein [Lacunisphaera sp.]
MKKNELVQSLREARHDPALRARLLADARFLRQFSWWGIAIGLILVAAGFWSTGSSGPWTLHQAMANSTSALLVLFSVVMMYDKATDRIAVLVSMEDPPATPAPADAAAAGPA